MASANARLTKPPGKNTPVDLAQAEDRVFGCNREVASNERSERAAEAETIDHGDGRLGKSKKPPPAPLLRRPTRLAPFQRIIVRPSEVLAPILSRTPGRPGARYHQYLSVFIDL